MEYNPLALPYRVDESPPVIPLSSPSEAHLWWMDPIERVLTVDFMERKQRDWTLYSFEQWRDFVIPSEIVESETDYLYLRRYQGRRGHPPAFYSPTRDHKKNLLMNFPLVDDVLRLGKGKLIVAGGFFTSYTQTIMDLDFFFHSCTEAEANQIVGECVEYIVTSYMDEILHYQENRTQRNTFLNFESMTLREAVIEGRFTNLEHHTFDVQIERKLNVTNVTFIMSRNHGDTVYQVRKYQFIHRIYPNFGQILGGFDIGASMVGYDGEDFYATYMGAWTLMNQIIVLDISRRSTTFGARLRKYSNRGFDVYIPGVKRRSKFFPERNSNDDRVKKCAEKIRALLQEYELELCQGGGFDYDGHSYSSTGPLHNQLTDKSRIFFFGDFCFREGGGTGILPEPRRSPEEQEANDYCGWEITCYDHSIDSMNTRAMFLNRPEAFSLCINHKALEKAYVEKGRKGIRTLYQDSFRDPQLELGDDGLIYFKRLEKFLDMTPLDIACFRRDDKDHPVINYHGIPDKRFAPELEVPESAARWLSSCFLYYYINKDSLFIDNGDRLLSRDHVKSSMKSIEKWKKDMETPYWMTQNPQRQWTSSVNPVVTKASDYYGKCYVPVYAGFPLEVSQLLVSWWCIKRLGSPFSILSKDLFKYLMNTIVMITIRDSERNWAKHTYIKAIGYSKEGKKILITVVRKPIATKIGPDVSDKLKTLEAIDHLEKGHPIFPLSEFRNDYLMIFPLGYAEDMEKFYQEKIEARWIGGRSLLASDFPLVLDRENAKFISVASIGSQLPNPYITYSEEEIREIAEGIIQKKTIERKKPIMIFGVPSHPVPVEIDFQPAISQTVIPLLIITEQDVQLDILHRTLQKACVPVFQDGQLLDELESSSNSESEDDE